MKPKAITLNFICVPRLLPVTSFAQQTNSKKYAKQPPVLIHTTTHCPFNPYWVSTISLLLLLSLSMGCIKDHYEPDDPSGDEIVFDIDTLLPITLPGRDSLTVRSIDMDFFPTNGGGKINKHIDESSGKTFVPPGTYGVLIYTSDFFELDAVLYRGMNHIETAEAYARLTPGTGTLNPVVEEPDPLFATYIQSFSVNNSKVLLNSPLHPLVFTYTMRVEVEGLQYVQSAQARICGFYTSVFLKDGSYREEEQGDMIIAFRLENGYIATTFRSFGTHQSKSVTHSITIAFVDKGGNVKRVNLDDLTPTIKQLPHGGTIPVTQKITITGGGGGGGFDPGVNDWEDTEVELPV